MAGLIKPVSGEMESRKSDNTFTQYSFPENLGNHSMVFNFSAYSYNVDAGQESRVMISSIALPIPNNLSDSFNINVQKQELGGVGNAVREVAAMSAGGNLSMQGVLNAATSAVAGTARGKIAGLVDAVTGTNASKGLEIGLGALSNPRVALSFEGVELKTHSFSWTLAPQSARESDKLRNIIQKIKKSVLPTYNNTFGQKTFLNYPNVVDIFFLGTIEGYMYYFKRAMVSQFEVNYAGSGSPAFVEGGKPAVVTMTMNLTEIDIHTSEDYGGESVNNTLLSGTLTPITGTGAQ
jgi:hypothetical protein